ncbi:MAG: hypothetical protein ACSHYB_11285 [Roseibacillus sp.]
MGHGTNVRALARANATSAQFKPHRSVINAQLLPLGGMVQGIAVAASLRV